MPGRHRADVERAEVGGLGDVPLAPLGGRVMAKLVDVVLVALPVAFVLGVVEPGSLWLQVVVTQAVLVVYEAGLTASAGATPGKRIARLKVVRMDTGRPPGLVAAVVRAVLGVPVSLMPAVTALFDERTHRGWHDRLAGTVVVARGNA